VGVHGTALRLLPMLALMRPGGANVPVGQANRPAHPGWCGLWGGLDQGAVQFVVNKGKPGLNRPADSLLVTAEHPVTRARVTRRVRKCVHATRRYS
jgi:hypothetical protein